MIIAAIAAWLAFGLVRRSLFSRRIARALREFDAERDALRIAFLKAAAASGKPRGLAWKDVALDDRFILARDRANGELVGLAGATISFEAVAGGGMEEVEAVGNLRAATAVYTHNGREWTTQGRAVFNLEPREVLERYRDSLDPV
jgi:hypothetical protein